MTFFRRHQRSLSPNHTTMIVLILLFLLKGDAFCPFRVHKRAFPPPKNALRMATSSKHLKERYNKDKDKRPPPKKNKKRKQENAVTRLARAAANAAALYPPEPQQQQDTTSRTATGSLGNLRQLTKAIDEQLLKKNQVQNSFSPYLSLQPQDSMSLLLEYNEEHHYAVMNNKNNHQKHVAIVLDKTLQDDLVTCEYAARIRALVRLLMEEAVDVVCFCGSIQGENYVSNADAGYLFFRHLCAAQHVDLSQVDIYIDRTSKDDGMALANVVKHLQTHYIPDWFQESMLEEQQHESSSNNNMATAATSQRTKIHVHYSIISTGHHLCNLNDIHHRSPGQSLLRPMELMRKEYELDHGQEAVADTSWSYRYATYPYLYTAQDEAVAFMTRCYLLGQELVPLLMNLKGVVQEKEFFQRDNYLVLASIRRSLVSQMEELYKTKPTLRSDLRTPGRDVNVALEGVVLSLGRCIDLVRPAGLLVGSVSKTDFQKALRALEHAVSQLQTYCDPDAPLDPSEWGKLNTAGSGGEINEGNLTSHERLYTQLDDSLLESKEDEETSIQDEEEVWIVDDE